MVCKLNLLLKINPRFSSSDCLIFAERKVLNRQCLYAFTVLWGVRAPELYEFT